VLDDQYLITDFKKIKDLIVNIHRKENKQLWYFLCTICDYCIKFAELYLSIISC